MKMFFHLLIFFSLALAGLFIYQNYWDDIMVSLFGVEPEFTMYIGDQAIKVTVADTLSERKQGLSGVKSLRDLQGKLLIFDESDYHGIWMKDMLFPIDIIWIDENLEIVDIESNVKPDTYPDTIFGPQKPARYVLEMRAFFADSFQLKVGDRVNLPSDLLTPDIANRLRGQ